MVAAAARAVAEEEDQVLLRRHPRSMGRSTLEVLSDLGLEQRMTVVVKVLGLVHLVERIQGTRMGKTPRVPLAPCSVASRKGHCRSLPRRRGQSQRRRRLEWQLPNRFNPARHLLPERKRTLRGCVAGQERMNQLLFHKGMGVSFPRTRTGVTRIAMGKATIPGNVGLTRLSIAVGQIIMEPETAALHMAPANAATRVGAGAEVIEGAEAAPIIHSLRTATTPDITQPRIILPLPTTSTALILPMGNIPPKVQDLRNGHSEPRDHTQVTTTRATTGTPIRTCPRLLPPS